MIFTLKVNGVEYIHVKQHIAVKSTKEVVKNLSSVIEYEIPSDNALGSSYI